MNPVFFVAPEINAAVEQAIIITGAARSGTTMLGTLIHTLEGIEYIFEPPFLFSLLPLIDQLDFTTFSLLYNTYLYEDFLMDAVAGRRINLNRHDDSCIARAKSMSDIQSRINTQLRRADLFAMAQGHRIAYKMPDIIPFLPALQEWYPDSPIVVMFREPESVIASSQAKGWYQTHVRTSKVVQGPWKNLDPDLPFWVSDEDLDLYVQMDEIERLYLYYATIYEAATRLKCLVVDYDAFIREPVGQFTRVCEYISERKFTPLTGVRLHEIERSDHIPQATLGLIGADLRNRVLAVVEAMSVAASV